MSQYKAYPEYQETGSEFLGDIPMTWQVMKAKNLVKINMGQSPDSNDVNTDGDGIPFIQGNAEFGNLHPLEKNYCTSPTKICNKGDVLVSVRAPVGALNIADKEFVIGRGLGALSASSKVNESFLWYSMHTHKNQMDLMETGTTFKSVSGHDIKSILFSVPPISEQTAIATFLDRETSRIDRLIDAKKRFIERLKEKRQALISHAVTKGLDPDAPMKDSGVEWIGEIPEGWEVKRLKRASELITDKESAPEYEKNVIALENIESWTGRHIQSDSEYAGEGVRFLPDDILFGKLRPYLAKVLLASKPGEAVGDFFIIRSKAISPLFLRQILSSKGFIAEVNGSTYGTKMPRASWESMGSMFIPFPPKWESEEISRKIDEATSKIDRLILKTEESIDLLIEKRTALITAAVTGKIDVRDEA